MRCFRLSQSQSQSQSGFFRAFVLVVVVVVVVRVVALVAVVAGAEAGAGVAVAVGAGCVVAAGLSAALAVLEAPSASLSAEAPAPALPSALLSGRLSGRLSALRFTGLGSTAAAAGAAGAAAAGAAGALATCVRVSSARLAAAMAGPLAGPLPRAAEPSVAPWVPLRPPRGAAGTADACIAEVEAAERGADKGTPAAALAAVAGAGGRCPTSSGAGGTEDAACIAWSRREALIAASSCSSSIVASRPTVGRSSMSSSALAASAASSLVEAAVVRGGVLVGLAGLPCFGVFAVAGLGLGLTATSFLLEAGVLGALGLLLSSSDSSPSSSAAACFFFFRPLEAGAELGEEADWKRAAGSGSSAIPPLGSSSVDFLLLRLTCTSSSAASRAERMPVAPATSRELSRVRVSGNGIGGTCTRGALAQKDEPGKHSAGARAINSGAVFFALRHAAVSSALVTCVTTFRQPPVPTSPSLAFQLLLCLRSA